MWTTLKRKAGVVLASVGADEKPLKFVYFIAVRTGDPEDYESHWTSQGMDAQKTLRRILNTKNAHDGTETTEKGIVRAAVTLVEQEILATRKTAPKPEKLLELIAKDERVIESIKNHDAAAQQFVIGDTRGADGSITKTRAAKAAIEMLIKDPEAFKAFAKKQGIEL